MPFFFLFAVVVVVELPCILAERERKRGKTRFMALHTNSRIWFFFFKDHQLQCIPAVKSPSLCCL